MWMFELLTDHNRPANKPPQFAKNMTTQKSIHHKEAAPQTLYDLQKEVFSQVSASEYSEKAYLEYAMSVVTSRALPSVQDGCKPVHRRILYAMFKAGILPNTPPKKSARIVGDVLGRYHPHGDASVYDAMVRQGQAWSVRYPLIDGQGNFGSRDGDGAAAMRYTEARMSKVTEAYMGELRDECVDFKPNYDGEEVEPQFLPARLPFILLNGNPGIAVGMASSIPDHQLGEVVDATLELLRNPQATLQDLLKHIKGPDFATGGQIITPPEAIEKIYREGRGSVRVRAKYHVETEGKSWRLIFSEIPPSTNVAALMMQISERLNPEDNAIKSGKKVSADQILTKNLFQNAIGHFVDASDKNHPARLRIDPKNMRQDPQELAQLLLGFTDLECNEPCNFVLLGLDGRPGTKPLLSILQDWIAFRLSTIDRRVRHHLQKLQERKHILEGRQTVLDNLDAVIEIIKNSDEPKALLQERFGLSDLQVQDVLDLRLRQITKLEANSLRKELGEIAKKMEELSRIIASPANLRKQAAKELQQDKELFNDARRTEMAPSEKTDVAALKTKVLTQQQEWMTVAVSQKGWVKAVKKGADLKLKDGDTLRDRFDILNTGSIFLLDHRGTVFNLDVGSLGKDGAPINSLISLEPGAKVVWTLPVPTDPSSSVVLCQTGGYGFRVPVEALITRLKAGKRLMDVRMSPEEETQERERIAREGLMDAPTELFHTILMPVWMSSAEEVNLTVQTIEGSFSSYPVSELPLLSGKGQAKGVQLAKGKGIKAARFTSARPELVLKGLRNMAQPSSGSVASTADAEQASSVPTLVTKGRGDPQTIWTPLDRWLAQFSKQDRNAKPQELKGKAWDGKTVALVGHSLSNP